MALYPNGRYMTRSTYKGYGVAPGLDARLKSKGDRFNRFLSLNKTASTPDGYGAKTYIPPLRAGGMSSHKQVVTVDASGNVLAGGPVTGDFASTFTKVLAGMSLTVGLTGSTLVCSLTKQSAALSLTIGLSGSGEITLIGDGGLSLIVPFSGTGGVIHFTGDADLKGRLSLSGEWTPFTELSPENLAAAVWDSMLAQYQQVGSTGEALAAAGSGGVNYNALAQAVWEYATRTLTEGGSITVDEIMTDPRMLTVAKFLGLK
jgi:hypothetical protein